MHELLVAQMHLAELRERHARLRRQRALASEYRAARGKHRFRSRQRR